MHPATVIIGHFACLWWTTAHGCFWAYALSNIERNHKALLLLHGKMKKQLLASVEHEQRMCSPARSIYVVVCMYALGCLVFWLQ